MSATDGVVPLSTSADQEASDLAGALALLAGAQVEGVPAREDAWAVSLPFGRCGLDGKPREHLIVYGAADAYLDVLGLDGVRETPVVSNQIVAVEPRTVVRLRARPVAGQRVLVAFQTQDRTPLMGNAAPFTLDGVVPEEFAERLRKVHGVFDRVHGWWQDDRPAYQQALGAFFGGMAQRLAGNQEAAAIVAEAGRVGSYDVADERLLFDSQRSMLDAALLERIRSQDSELFRFPGMFGAITTLFNCVK